MASRLELHEELVEILGSEHVYFQPPASIKLVYPCIVYSRSDIDKKNADDGLYKSTNQYYVTVIDHDPDSEIPDNLLSHFAMCRFDRSFPSDNLNNSVLVLYY